MKIAYVVINANRREGTSRAIVEVAERLAEQHDVTLIARTVESVNLKKVRWQRVFAPSWPDVAEFEVSRLIMDQLLSKNRYDLVHSAGCNTRYADVYAIQTVHPVKVKVNSNTGRNRDAAMLRRFSRWLYDHRVNSAERRTYRQCNHRGIVGYLPVSQGTCDELLATYNLNGVPIEVVPNGADFTKFDRNKYASQRLQIRAQFGCPENAVVCLFAGGEWKRKGLQLALEAFAQAKQPANVLFVAGEDPEIVKYQQISRELGIADQVRWLGFRKDIECVLASADIFLFPSYYEAFSLATIEAASSRLPVIMCKISGAHELLGDGKAGIIANPNPLSVGKAITELSNSVVFREQMGENGRMKVEQLFNWDRIAEKTDAFYKRLLKERQSRRHQIEN